MVKRFAICLCLGLAVSARGQENPVQKGYELLQDQEYAEALAVFDRAEESLGGSFELYRYRARAHAHLGHIESGLDDISRAIEYRPDDADAYLARAQMYHISNEPARACEDITMAASLGSQTAQELVEMYCGELPPIVESVMVDWPDEEHWRVVSNEPDPQLGMLTLTRDGETLDNWTDLGFMLALYGRVLGSLEEVAELAYVMASNEAPHTVPEVIRQDDEAEYPWIIIKFENTGRNGDSEAQVWYLVQGASTLFAIIRVIPTDEVPGDKLDALERFFASARVLPAGVPVAEQ